MDEHPTNVPPLGKGRRPPEVEAELTRLYALTDEQRRDLFATSVQTGSGCCCEALVHFCARAFATDDQGLVTLTFEALSRTATPMLSSLARKRPPADREDHAQEILMIAYEFIQAGRADFLECRFAVFAKRRSIDLFRKENRRLESQQVRNEPIATHDPLDDVPDRGLGPEDEAILQEALDKLPQRLRLPYIQYHRMGLTKEEIARHHGVSTRTVYTWLKEALRILEDLYGQQDK